MTADTKADYVRSQGQTRKHHCHWPGCDKQVPPAMWGCKAHWFALPPTLRNRIWATYKPGQEVNGTPSAAYIEAAKALQAWIAGKEKAGTFLQVPASGRAAHSVSNEKGDDPHTLPNDMADTANNQEWAKRAP